MGEVILYTDGSGYWSNTATGVRITDMVLDVGTEWDDEPGKYFGEFRVYFDTETWDTEKHGLIYTDGQFKRELRAFLDSHGLPGADVCYSEQGMQGDDYVSLDAGTDFYNAWMQKFGIAKERLVEQY